VSPKDDPAEVAVLNAQLSLMRDYDQRLLSTVYWSLGTIATIADSWGSTQMLFAQNVRCLELA